MAIMLVPRATLARGGDAHVFSVGLLGEPEVGCIVTTDEGACAENTFTGALVPEGGATFRGGFAFNLPGLRGDARQPLTSKGHGRLEGELAPSAGAPALRCAIQGRMRTRGVFLPSGSSTRRFYTGLFEGGGRCAGRRVKLRAIWSGSIGPVEGPLTFDFERFQGRLAGTLVFR